MRDAIGSVPNVDPPEAEPGGGRLLLAWRGTSTIRTLLLAGGVALLLGGLLVLLVGISPLSAYSSLWQGAFGSRQAVGETLLRFGLFSMIGLGLIPALRANVVSVGAEGQVAMGALLAGLTALALRDAPGPLVIAVAALAGAFGGSLWAAVPAVMRVALGVSEILTTLAFNFIGVFLLSWLLNGPLQAPGVGLVRTEVTPEHTWLPALLPGTRAHMGLVLLPLLAAAIAVFERTAHGYRVEVYGANPSLARIAGISPARIIVTTMLVAGATAGIAGWMQVAGVDRAVYGTVARGTAFVGILVVFLGNAGVAGTLAAALLFAALSTGGEFMQIGAGVSPELIGAIQGVALLIVAARLRRRGPA
jgi:general nucleoside transport system permease protein